jgi:hypothetical protein
MTVRTVWAITSGSYSDYSIRLICDSKEVAEAQAELWNGLTCDNGEFSVEEFPCTDSLIPRSAYYMHQVYDLPGGYGEYGHVNVFLPGERPPESLADQVIVTDPFSAGGGKGAISVTGRSSMSAERTRKIAQDRYAYEKAKRSEIT